MGKISIQSATEYKKFADTVSDSITFGVVQKMNGHKHIWKAVEIPLFFLILMCEAEFSSHASAFTMYHNRLNAEADVWGSDKH